MPHATSIEILKKGFTAAGVLQAHRFFTRALVRAGAGVSTLGVTDHEAKLGEEFPGILMGSAKVEVGAAVDSTVAYVESDADGRAIARTTGKIAGIVMPGSTPTAVGQLIEILVVQTP